MDSSSIRTTNGRSETVSRSIPTGFRSLVRARLLSTNTVQAISRVQARSKGQWLKTAPRSSIHTALSPLYMSIYGHQDIDTLLFLGLILYSAVWHSSLHAEHSMMLWSAMIQWIRQDLTNRLLLDKANRSRAERYCIFWIWHVVIGSWAKKDASRCSSQVQTLQDQILERFEPEFASGKSTALLGQFFSLRTFKLP
jgi:hypothetical protein